MAPRSACAACAPGFYDHDRDAATPCRPCARGFVVGGAPHRTACTLDDACEAREDECAPRSQANCTRTGFGTHACECRVGFWGDGRWCAPWTRCLLGAAREALGC